MKSKKEAVHSGTLFFKPKYESMDLERAIDRLNSFEAFEQYYTDDLMDANQLLPEYLYYLIDKYNTNPNRLADRIGWSHDYVRQLVNGTRTNPDRDPMLAICVSLKTTVEEAQILLKYAGNQPLYARRKRDAIIWFALKKHQDLRDLDEYLLNHGYDTLGKYK